MAVQLDHLVVDVRDRMEEAVRRYQALGFRLTPRGRHSLGSANHLVILGTDYLELLGTDLPGGELRPDLAGFPVGANGLVFRGQDLLSLYPKQQAREVPVQQPLSFHRPVGLEDGSSAGDARFTVLRLEPRCCFDGRVYWCEHFTPELVWRKEWQEHPNGALAVCRVLLAAAEPARPTGMLERMFGPGALVTGADRQTMPLAYGARIEIAPASAVAAELGGLMPEASGRQDFMALFGLRVASLAATEALLAGNGIKAQRIGATLRVPPAEAMNVTLEFSE